MYITKNINYTGANLTVHYEEHGPDPEVGVFQTEILILKIFAGGEDITPLMSENIIENIKFEL